MTSGATLIFRGLVLGEMQGPAYKWFIGLRDMQSQGSRRPADGTAAWPHRVSFRGGKSVDPGTETLSPEAHDMDKG